LYKRFLFNIIISTTPLHDSFEQDYIYTRGLLSPKRVVLVEVVVVVGTLYLLVCNFFLVHIYSYVYIYIYIYVGHSFSLLLSRLV